MLITNIKGLVGIHPKEKLVLRGSEMAQLPILENAWLLIANGLIKDFGTMDSVPSSFPLSSTINAMGRFLLPSWCDSHTHLIFAAPREEEFVMKISGQSYEAIAAAGGGILNSAKKLEHATEDELFESASGRLKEMMLLGTGAVEIKSGYGLTVESELKMLRVIKRLKDTFPIPIKATLLAAHAFPLAYKNNHQGYIKIIIEELLPIVAREKLADYMDVFCEQGFFLCRRNPSAAQRGDQVWIKTKNPCQSAFAVWRGSGWCSKQCAFRRPFGRNRPKCARMFSDQ
jgi:imidazolonepropionase